MSQQFYDEYGQPVDPFAQQQPEPQQTPNWRRDLETRATKAQEEAQAAQQRAEAAERKLAFVEAGVPLDNPMTNYFVNGYQGDLTADAIKAEAAKIGLVAPPAPPTPPAQTEAAQGFQRMQQATDGHVAPAERDFDAEIKAAPNREAAHHLIREKHAVHGPPGTPAIVEG